MRENELLTDRETKARYLFVFRKKDTIEIGILMDCSEAEAVRLLHAAREKGRKR